MKLLVCTDGSKNSRRVIEESIKIAKGCKVFEVTVINVYEDYSYLNAWRTTYAGASGNTETEYLKRLKELEDQNKREREKILAEAAKLFEENNIKVNTILEEGHPAETITEVASAGGFDMVVIGCRGLGGLKSTLFGSVCNAVAQKVKANLVVIKQ